MELQINKSTADTENKQFPRVSLKSGTRNGTLVSIQRWVFIAPYALRFPMPTSAKSKISSSPARVGGKVVIERSFPARSGSITKFS